MSSPEQRRIAELEAENAALRGRLDAASDGDGDLGPFLDGLAVGVVEADADGRMTRVNRRWCEMLASDEKTLLGRSIAEVTHPDSLPATVAAVERLSGGGPDFEIDKNYVRADGSVLNATSHVAARRGPGGEYRGLVAVVLDIGERKRAEAALRESEERFRLIFDAVKDFAVFLMDPAGLVASWNEGAERILGYNEAEIVGRSGAIFFTPEDRARGLPEQELRTAAETGRASDENWLVRKSGEWFWASGASTALRDSAGRLQGFIKIFRDLTERKAVEETLQRLNAELEDRVRERTAELRASEGRLRTLAAQLTRVEQQERQKLARMLHDHVQQLLVAAKLRLEVTDFGQPEAGRKAVGEAVAILNESIDATRSLSVQLSPPLLHDAGLPAALEWLVARTARGAGMAVEADIDEDADPAEAEGRDVLFQAAQELLVNTAKHAGGGGVTLQLGRLETEIWLEVCDSGRGFDPAAATAARGSYGLLRIRQRLESLGGSLSVESRPGGGACVSATLPAPAVPHADE